MSPISTRRFASVRVTAALLPLLILIALAFAIVPAPLARSSEDGATPQAAPLADGDIAFIGDWWERDSVRGFEVRAAGGGNAFGHVYARYTWIDPAGDMLHRLECKQVFVQMGQVTRGQLIVDMHADALPAAVEYRMAQGTFWLTFEDDVIHAIDSHGERDFEDMPLLPLFENNNLFLLELAIARVPIPGVGESVDVPVRAVTSLAAFDYSITVESVDEDTGVMVFSDSLGETITWAAEGGIERLEAAGIEMVAIEDPEFPDWEIEPIEPFAYALPDDATFSEREVRIPRPVNDGDGSPGPFEIAGTLNVPDATVHGEGPYAAVLFISGSGTQNRYGVAAGMDLGTWEVLDAVANAGLVTLRVDDRGAGGTPMGADGTKPEDVGYWDLVGDSRACVQWLREQPEVDASRVFLIGHSEGGFTAPILANEEDLGIAGFVSMAGGGRNLREIILDQNMAFVEGQGMSPAELRNIRRSNEEMASAIAEDREPDFDLVPESAWEESKPIRKWLRDHYLLDIEAVHAAVTCPVLVVQGDSDFQVNHERDARPYARHLADGNCRDVTLRIFDDLDHLFKPCGGEKSSMEQYADRSRRVSPEFLEVLIDWLTRHAEALASD